MWAICCYCVMLCAFLGLKGAEGDSGSPGIPGRKGERGEDGIPGREGKILFCLMFCCHTESSKSTLMNYHD